MRPTAVATPSRDDRPGGCAALLVLALVLSPALGRALSGAPVPPDPPVTADRFVGEWTYVWGTRPGRATFRSDGTYLIVYAARVADCADDASEGLYVESGTWEFDGRDLVLSEWHWRSQWGGEPTRMGTFRIAFPPRAAALIGKGWSRVEFKPLERP